MHNCKYNKAPIKNLSALQSILHANDPHYIKHLSLVADRPDVENYRDPKKPAYKKDGTIRRIKSPSQELRSVQNRINRNLFKTNIDWPPYLFGSIPRNKNDEESSPQDYIEAASKHCSAKSICKLDISDFFDNIHRDKVKKIFTGLFRFSDDVSELLTKLVTYECRLVQGALTSSYIAMLILWQHEPSVVDRLKKKGIIYTRLVDDITLSSSVYNYDFSHCIKLIEEMLHKNDLFLNKNKVSISSISNNHLTVHGLNVSFKEPHLPKEEAKRIKAAVCHLEKIIEVNDVRSEVWYRKDYFSCLGRVHKLKRFGKLKMYNTLLAKLKKIEPMPSDKDIKYTKNRLTRLENDYKYPVKRSSYSFQRRYSIAAYRISFIKKKFETQAEKLKERLKRVIPDYKI